MTALAAVMTLAAAPLSAQTIDPAASPAPVIIAPPAPDVAPSGPDAPAAATAAPSSAVAEAGVSLQPATAARTIGTPVLHQPAATGDRDAVAPVARTATPVVRRAAASMPATPVKPAAEKAAAPVEHVRAMPSPPLAERSPRQPAALVADPGDGGGIGERTIALGGGLGAVALGGVAFLLFRRRRVEPLDAVSGDASGTSMGVPHAVVAPAFRSPFTPLPAGRVPDGFDTARFGPHVRAAYAGPTPGNPSLSLKRRLARARFFDQRARIGQRFDTARRAAGFVTTRLRPATVAPVYQA